MLLKQETIEDAYIIVLQRLSNKVKAKLPESQYLVV